MRKFHTNSSSLHQKIAENEGKLSENDCVVSENGLKKTQSLDSKELQEEVQVLGVKWNCVNDRLVFDVRPISQIMQSLEPTNRNVVSLVTRFFDPLGIMSPITVRFKLLFQLLCGSKLSWDQPLSGESLTEWNSLNHCLSLFSPVSVPRCYTAGIHGGISNFSLMGFCDASLKAYAAVVYLCIQSETGCYLRFLCARTRIAPTKRLTVPRLELLSAILLSMICGKCPTCIRE